MTISPNARTVFRNYVTDGVPSSGAHNVKKSDERTWGTAVEAAIDAYSSGAGSIAKSTRALLYADLAHVAGATAWAYADSTTAYNGIYVKAGASGTGSWSRILDLPYSFVVGTDAGAGTANAIQITTSVPVSDGMIVAFGLFEATTSSPVTVSINGGSALTLKTNRGNNASALTADMDIWGRIRTDDSSFILLNDQDVSALVAQAETARDEAVAAKVAAEAAAASALATVATYGGSSSADSSTAIAAMATALGFVRFGAGSTLVSADITIDVPIEFQMGAYITVASTKTVTITNRIESPRQHIFRGDGSYVLGHDSDSGEDARQVHVSWFGALPYPGTMTDQAPLIQKAATAMGNLRESEIEFDIGNYTVLSKVTLTRGCHIKGHGTRRTVFRTNLGDHLLFETGGVAAKVTAYNLR